MYTSILNTRTRAHSRTHNTYTLHTNIPSLLQSARQTLRHKTSSRIYRAKNYGDNKLAPCL